MYQEGKEKDPLYTVEGQWSESFVIKEGSKKRGGEIDSYAAAKYNTTPLIVAPIEQQYEREAHRAWGKVIGAIQKGDMDTTNREKSLIEEREREMRRKEVANKEEWQRWFFKRTDNDPLFDKLARPIGERIEAEKTGGIWRFNSEHAKQQEGRFNGANVLERAGLK